MLAVIGCLCCRPGAEESQGQESSPGVPKSSWPRLATDGAAETKHNPTVSKHLLLVTPDVSEYMGIHDIQNYVMHDATRRAMTTPGKAVGASK